MKEKVTIQDVFSRRDAETQSSILVFFGFSYLNENLINQIPAWLRVSASPREKNSCWKTS